MFDAESSERIQGLNSPWVNVFCFLDFSQTAAALWTKIWYQNNVTHITVLFTFFRISENFELSL